VNRGCSVALAKADGVAPELFRRDSGSGLCGEVGDGEARVLCSCFCVVVCETGCVARVKTDNPYPSVDTRTRNYSPNR